MTAEPETPTAGPRETSPVYTLGSGPAVPTDLSQVPVDPRILGAVIAAGQTLHTLLPETLELLNTISQVANRAMAESLSHFAATWARIAPLVTGPWPDNWLDREANLRPRPLLELACAGIPVTWVPRTEVLVELIATPAATRSEVLLTRQSEILTDCEANLDVIADGYYAAQVPGLRQTIATLRDGHYFPAQTASASVIDTVLKDYHPQYGEWRTWAKGAADRAFTPTEVSFFATAAPLALALATFHPDRGDPVPTHFNRHAVAHASGTEQFSAFNALIGVMLAVSIVRELHEEELDEAAGVA